MKSPYAALLALRRVEEKEAEVLFAERRRHVQAIDAELATARDGREAWITEHLDRPAAGAGDGLAARVARIEAVERHARARLADAEERAEAARLELLERRRQREAVERLHLEVLAREAAAQARREQAELDDLGGIGVRRRSEDVVGNSC